ncbi:MAG: phospholipid carrier-dependent glycosyltransferase [Candidatus Moranbacteria bacterium]|nr:phospholipid carrier-dependent glycosyltransferase [Candidatus Moranbacteria bacterium]
MKQKIIEFINKTQKYYIFFIVLLGSVLRLTNLGVRDFWYDEAFTGIAIKEPFAQMFKIIINDVHPPLYYALLKPFASLFDYNVFSIRLFSAIFGILSIIGVYFLVKQLLNKKAALFGSFLIAISPFMIQYSKEGRMYTMFAFLVILAFYFLVLAEKNKKIIYSFLFGIFVGLSCLTHYAGLLFLPIYYLFWIFYTKDFRKLSLDFKKIVLFLKPNKRLFIGIISAFLVFLPWSRTFFNHFFQQTQSNSLDWIEPPVFYDIFYNIQMFLFGTPLGEMSSGMPSPNEFYFFDNRSVFVFLIIFLAFSTVYLIKNNFKKTVILLIPSLGFLLLVFLLSFFGKYFMVARYLLPGAFFIFVFLGYLLSKVSFNKKIFFLALYMGLILLIAPVQFSTGWNRFKNNLKQYEDKNFYILNSFDYVIAKYYLENERLTLYNIDWPAYNPSYWAAIGDDLKRTESVQEIKDDPNALIISNVQLEGKDNQNFDPNQLILVDKYKNILLYKY